MVTVGTDVSQRLSLASLSDAGVRQREKDFHASIILPGDLRLL